MYIKDSISYTLCKDLSIFIPYIFESLFIEINKQKHNLNQTVAVIYKPNTAPKADLNIFSTTYLKTLEKLNVTMGDFNIDLLQSNKHNTMDEFISNVFSQGFVPVIAKPTRISHDSATLIDHIYTNNITSPSKSGIITTDIADHFGVFHISETPLL